MIISYDLRRSGPEPARHWTDAHALGGRASFQMVKGPRTRGPGSNGASSPIKRRKRKSFLRIRDVINTDRGLYRCRVDFQGAPTRNSMANLTVIGKLETFFFGLSYYTSIAIKAFTNNTFVFLYTLVPPKPPVIVDDFGREASATIGPYAEGRSVEVSCEVSGGKLNSIKWFTKSKSMITYFLKIKTSCTLNYRFKLTMKLKFINKNNHSYEKP